MNLFKSAAAAVVTLISLPALAVSSPPVIDDTVTLVIQGSSTNDAVNLLEAGYITGSPPLRISNVSVLDENGLPADLNGNSIVGDDVVIVDDLCVQFIFDDDAPLPSGPKTFYSLQFTVANGIAPDAMASFAAGNPIRMVQGGNVDSPVNCTDINIPPDTPVISAGSASPVADTDGAAGEIVSFSALTNDADGEVDPTSYRWTVNGVAVGAADGNTNPSLSLPLDGVNTVELTVEDNGGAISTAGRVTVTVNGNQAPTATISFMGSVVPDGNSIPVVDSNSVAGEDVTLTGAATDSEDGTLDSSSFQWSIGGVQDTSLDGMMSITQNLPDGATDITLTAADRFGLTNSVTITVDIAPPGQNTGPIVTIVGGDRTVLDSDGQAGESAVAFSAVATDPDGVDQTSFRWSVNGVAIAAADGLTDPALDLPLDGANTVGLTVADSLGATSSTSVTVTVLAPAANVPPVAVIEDGNRQVDDTDGQPGEPAVAFFGMATDDEDGTVDVSTFRWAVNQVAVGGADGQASPSLDLPLDGDNTVELTVTDSDGASSSATVTIVVAAPLMSTGPSLIDNLDENFTLTPNQRSMTQAVGGVCNSLVAVSQQGGSLTDDQSDLLTRCSLIISNSDSPQEQFDAVMALGGEELSSLQTSGNDFSSIQLGNVGARVEALRFGSTGVSIAGLNIRKGHQDLPIEELLAFAKTLLGGGGASGDDDDPGYDLLSRKLGLWINGSIVTGDKDRTRNEGGYDFDGWGITAGVDYRFQPGLVLGAAIGYNDNDTDFATGGGGVDADGVSGSLYGVYYGEKAYLEVIGTLTGLDYDSTRNISFTDTSGPQTRVARGSTDGDIKAGGLATGYEFVNGGWNFTPNFATTYTRIDVDPFSEQGAMGLNLAYGRQAAESWTVQGGLRVGYTASKTWGVLQPQFHFAFVRELENDGEVIRVNFVSDPFINDPTQASSGITIFTDEPDRSYIRWGVGLSAAFANGVSGFADYETYSGLSGVSVHEFSFGVRTMLKFK